MSQNLISPLGGFDIYGKNGLILAELAPEPTSDVIREETECSFNVEGHLLP